MIVDGNQPNPDLNGKHGVSHGFIISYMLPKEVRVIEASFGNHLARVGGTSKPFG